MHHNNCKVSVIVPIFNAEKFLRPCLDSVTHQTLSEIQIILVNDGSTDSSGDICRDYAKNDPRILYVQKQNGGLASARKAGLEHATSPYVGFVDSDDWVELNCYEKMYCAAEEHSADIVLCDAMVNDTKIPSAYVKSGYYDRDRTRTEIFPRTLASFNADKKNERIRWANYIRLYRKEMIDKHNISFDIRFRRCQDLPFTFECTIHANGIYYLEEEYLYHNRPVVDSLSKSYTEQMWNLLKPLMQYLDEIVKRYKSHDFSSQMALRAFMFTMNCIENEAKPNNKRKIADRLRTIRSIFHDTYTREFVEKIDASSVSRLYKMYYITLKHRLVIPAYLIAYYRLRNRRKQYKAEVAAANSTANSV